MSGAGGKRPARKGERLQKVLARAGVASRRKVEEMIREGRIAVNGAPATLGQRVDLAVDAVKVDGRRVFARAGERRYVLLHKPAGCVSTRADPEGRPTVIDLLPPRMRRGLVPVGRLDYETEGLLILTDDGDFAQRVAHPSHGCVKTYEAKVKGRPREAEIERLRQGVKLGGRLAVPVSIESRPAPAGPRDSVRNSWWTIRLAEGRTRQIREMFFRIGHPVSRLRRVAIGRVADPRLPRGAWRDLTEREVASLRRKTSTKGAPAKGASAKGASAKGASAKGRPARSRSAKGRPAKGRPAKGRPAKHRPTKGRGPKGGGKGRGGSGKRAGRG